MLHKQRFIYFSVLFLLIGCTSTKSNLLKNAKSHQYSLTHDLEMIDNVAFLPNEDEPFTGTRALYDNFDDPQKKIKRLEYSYKDGKKHGLHTWWYNNGHKWQEVYYENDVVKWSNSFYEDGRVKSSSNKWIGQKDIK